jgi:modification methylase
MAIGPVPTNGRRQRRSTETSRFGSSRRESHDASLFYERFTPPEISKDDVVVRPNRVDSIEHADAREMTGVAANSVALVVTSPPYFAGKEYEEALGSNGVPATYFEYLTLLSDVFAECKRVLEPGGRIAVNVANLGRRPFRSLAADVGDVLQDLGFLMRGEVVWWKGKRAGASCAWGTFQRPSNPVLRDVTERIVVASKGRFDRALTPQQRHRLGLPSTATISKDEFLEATTDLWEIPAESATRVGHPAPFPVDLPKRLIELFTYEGDLVLDPFMGSGTTAVAALQTRRHYLGFDTDGEYVDIARMRVDEERRRQKAETEHRRALRVQLPAVPGPADEPIDVRARAVREGQQAKELARVLLKACGFVAIREDVRVPHAGLEISFMARDRTGGEWAFDVSGAFTASQPGLRRTDTLWKAIGRASVLHRHLGDVPLVLLTTDAPAKGSSGQRALRVVSGPKQPVFDLVELLHVPDQERLRAYALDGARGSP